MLGHFQARRRILAPVHRPTYASSPATTHTLPSQCSGVAHSGVSTGTLLRRASMPTDSLQLYHPLSLQSLPHSGSDTIGTDPYYTFSSQRKVLENGYVGERSSPVMGNYGRGQHSGETGAAGYTFPTPVSMSTHHQPGYSMANHHNPTYTSSHGPLAGSGGHGYHSQQQHQQYFSESHQDRSTPTPSSGSGSGNDLVAP